MSRWFLYLDYMDITTSGGVYLRGDTSDQLFGGWDYQQSAIKQLTQFQGRVLQFPPQKLRIKEHLQTQEQVASQLTA